MNKFTKLTANTKAATSRISDNAKEIGIKVRKVAAVKAEAVGANIYDGMRTARAALDGTAVLVTEGARKGVDVAKVVAHAASNNVSAGVDVARRSATTVATAAFDQNGDGKVDQDDLKILTQKFVATGREVANELGRSELVKKAAAGALVGGALASVLPVIGTVTGAVIGGAGAAYKHFTDK